MLFSPIKIGSTMIKNRVVVTAHLTNFGKQPENIINDKYISYLERRAKGGVGLIITEVTDSFTKSDPKGKASLNKILPTVVSTIPFSVLIVISCLSSIFSD